MKFFVKICHFRPPRFGVDRRIFEFFLRFGLELNFILQFLIEKHQNLEKRREKNFCEKCDFFGFCDFGVNFFRKICSNFLFLSLLWARLG